MSSDPRNDVALSVRDVSKCYEIYERPHHRLKQSLWHGRRQFYREFWALKDVSFEMMRGETLGIIGRNGSGKSTLLQIIAGVLRPTQGMVQIHGRVTALLELGSGFNIEFTGRENVMMQGSIMGYSPERMAELFDQIATFADIGDFIEQPVKTYSSGMTMRLAFAVSVTCEPEILIVDEALSVGDAGFQFKCMERLDQLVESGTTLLFVSHDLGTVKTYCKRAVYLQEGRCKFQGTADDTIDLFNLDIREEQAKAAGTGVKVAPQPSLNDSKLSSFGTDRATLLEASFMPCGSHSRSFGPDEEVSIHLQMAFDPAVQSPAFTLYVQDARLFPVFGKSMYLPAEKAVAVGAKRVYEARCSFKNTLNYGIYFVTVRMENRRGEKLENVEFLGKQSGVLQINSTEPNPGSGVGVVRHPIEMSVE